MTSNPSNRRPRAEYLTTQERIEELEAAFAELAAAILALESRLTELENQLALIGEPIHAFPELTEEAEP